MDVEKRLADLLISSELEKIANSASGLDSKQVLEKLSLINGKINRKSKPELMQELDRLGLETRGCKDILRKRMKSAYRTKMFKSARLNLNNESNPNYRYLAVIDFEATCEKVNKPDYLYEIIEFPAVLIDVQKREIVDEFHAYCKPVRQRKLSKFCTQLTGIDQDTVDAAEPFSEVFKKFNEFLNKYHINLDLGGGSSFCIVTDSAWDVSKFLAPQCQISDVKFPSYARKWVNVRKTFGNFYQINRCNLQAMLDLLCFEFEGEPHRGIDDARNIARIVMQLLMDGAFFAANEVISFEMDGKGKLQAKALPYVFKKKHRTAGQIQRKAIKKLLKKQESDWVDDAEGEEPCAAKGFALLSDEGGEVSGNSE